MDHTEALPRDVLASILARLSPRDLAASRCVRAAWRALVDRRRLLRLRAEDLPHSVEGIFANCNDVPRPYFLGRPSTQHPRVDYGNLYFLPDYDNGHHKITDHCNGLLLYGGCEFWVVNPATRGWEHLPPMHADDGEYRKAYLAFDPTESPHYEVFMIQSKDLGLFDLTDCNDAGVPPEQLVEGNFTLSCRSLSKDPGSSEVPQHSEEWPPPLLTLEVFSSEKGQWHERPFVREGSATTRVVNARGTLWFMGYGGLFSEKRWHYRVYCHGSLHVLLFRGEFVTRLSSYNGKFQVIKTPIYAKPESKAGQSYIGKLGKDVYFASIHDQIRIWTMSESSGQIDWVPKSNISLEPLANITSLLEELPSPWILNDYDVLDKYGDNKKLAKEDFDWDSDDDNILDTDNTCGHLSKFLDLIGFHPYKEVAFFLVDRFDAVALHLDSPKVQYIGYLRPSYDSYTMTVDDTFLYTPCMTGDLKKISKRYW